MEPERMGRILPYMEKPKAGFYVRFSPHAAAIDAMAEDLLHYKLTLPEKRDMLGKLRESACGTRDGKRNSRSSVGARVRRGSRRN